MYQSIGLFKIVASIEGQLNDIYLYISVMTGASFNGCFILRLPHYVIDFECNILTGAINVVRMIYRGRLYNGCHVKSRWPAPGPDGSDESNGPNGNVGVVNATRPETIAK